MLQQLAFFNNKIFVPFFNGSNAYLVTYEYNINGEDKSFKEKFRRNIPIRLNLKIRNILLEVVDNQLTGFRTLIIVIIYDHQKIALYFHDENAKNILYESDFIHSFPKNLVPNINIAFTHGPICLMVTKGELCVYSLLHLSKKNYNFYIKDVSYDKVKILQFLSIEAIYSTFNLILVSLSIETNEHQVILFGALLLNNNGGIFSNEFIILPETFFLPKCYHNELNAIKICGLDFSEFLENLNLNILDLPWANNISIVAFPEQCIVFKGGQINYCCKVPLLDINSIIVKSNALFCFSGNVSVILQSASKGVCFINKKANADKFEIIQTWNNAICLLIGDFLKNSSLQLLLLLNISFENWQDGFILSEFSSSLPTAPLEQHKIPDEYLKNTVTGLSKKIHAGKLSIARKENEISQKTLATLDALYRLDECSYKIDDSDLNHISSFQESLVDIILHADENPKNDQELESTPLLKIENHWSTLLLNHWILCWTLKNESNDFICHPMVLILFENIEVQCKQKLLVCNSSLTRVETMAENEIESGKTFMLVANFEIPSMFENEIEVNAIITWQKGKVRENNNEYLNLKEQNNLNLQFVTISKLNMAEIFHQQTNKDIFKEEKFISLKALQQRNIFYLTTYKSDVSDLKNSLLKNDSTNKLSPLDESHFIFREEKSLLFGICLNFLYIDTNNMEIEAFTRNERETVIFVQWLYHSLPDDIIIMPKEKSTQEINEMKKKILICMKEELDLLSSSLNIFNIIPKLLQENDLANLNVPDMHGVIIPKETYARIRKVLAKKEILTDTIIKTLA